MTTSSIWKYKQVGNLLLICASEGQLRDEDFDPCLALHRTNQVTRAVVWSLGNTQMTALQRKKAGDAMGSHPSANITDSALVRGLITAFSWMGKPWTPFSPKNLREAVKHIGVPEGFTAEEVLAELNTLKQAVEAQMISRVAS